MSTSVTLRLIGDAGTQIGDTRTLTIGGRGKIRIEDPQFFVDPKGALVQGYVEVASSGGKLAGSVIFSDPGRRVFATALPLASRLAAELVFSQVASDERWFTGLALLNPNTSDISATVRVFDKDGLVLRQKVIAIKAGQRLSKLLVEKEFFADLKSLSISSGYITVSADRAITGFAVFGTNDLEVLSVIPAQMLP